MVFYQDREIEITQNDVLLSGGYSGHANFGDVAQLKSVISWYKSQGYQAVVIIRLDSIYDENFIKNLYKWFDVKAFIFYSPTLFDVSKYNLFISTTFRCDRFHLYGGGMINRFWAKAIINLTENIINKFQVKDYILSGQQIDSFGASLLVDHFENYTPSLVGVRDNKSLENLKTQNIQALYSFDDAYEELELLQKSFSMQESNEQEIYLHFNISPYVSDDLVTLVQEFVSSLEIVKKRFPNAKYKLLLTYLDSRILSIVDTLGVIGSLDYHFDMDEVTIVNLASISLKNDTKRNIFINPNSIVLATSYHTAMFMQLLGLRVYMFAGNDYYEQKREGLTLSDISLDDALNIPLYPSHEKVRENARTLWLDTLKKNIGLNLVTNQLSFNEVYPKAQIIYKHKQIQTNLEASIAAINKNRIIQNKVYGIGWAKTGTTTLGEALTILGYKHKTQDFTLVNDLMKGEYSSIKQELINYESFDDWPWITLYKQLDIMSENSKFILTIRDTDSWIKSYRNMLKNEGNPSEQTNKMRSFLYTLSFPNVTDEELIQRYEQHIKEVKEYFKYRPNNLLIVNWSEDGNWEKICAFLNKKIPTSSFPHKNQGVYKV